MSIKFLLPLTSCTSHIQSDVNHIVVTRHVRSPIDSKLVSNCRLAGLSVTENCQNNKSGEMSWGLSCIKDFLHFDKHWKGSVSQLFTPTGWVENLNSRSGAMCQWNLIRTLSRQGNAIEFLGKLLSCVIQYSNKSVSFC